MATRHSRSAARVMIARAVFVLLDWMIVPLCMTPYVSFADDRPVRARIDAWIGFSNYTLFPTSSAFLRSVATTLWMVGGILAITIGGSVLLPLPLDQPMFGRGNVRILVIGPFFGMPTVSALVWKNLFFNVDNGLFSDLFRTLDPQPYDVLSQSALFSIVVIVASQWLPFATLILLTAVQSLDSEQFEAAEIDGAPPLKQFWFIILPHPSRAIAGVILIQTIFLLSIFVEIFVATNGAFGMRTPTCLVYQCGLESRNIGLGSANGIVAIILANIVAIFLMRIVGKNLD